MSTIKKIVLVLIILIVLTACGSMAEEQTSSTTDSAVEESSEELQGEGETEESRQLFRGNLADNQLPPATQLAVGIMLLDSTDLAVETEQVQILIPYWKLYKNLLESDATAQEELKAMIGEIEGVMTPDQLSYITELDLVQEDLMTLMSDLGINQGLRPDGEEDGEGFTRPEGMEGMQPGGGAGRGQGGFEGMDMNPELMATMEARREEMGGGGFMGANRMQVPLIEALIELLEGKLELE